MRKIFNKFGILIFFLLNIALPTVDVITDILMIVKLFRGAHGCVNPKWWSEDHKLWQECLQHPNTFCPNRTPGGCNGTQTTYDCREPDQSDCRERLIDSENICNLTRKGNLVSWKCSDPYLWSRDYKDWGACRESPTEFCSKRTNETIICVIESHPKFGISLMIPYLFNYLISFHTWWRLEKKREKTFIFPLINMYAQLGRCANYRNLQE